MILMSQSALFPKENENALKCIFILWENVMLVHQIAICKTEHLSLYSAIIKTCKMEVNLSVKCMVHPESGTLEFIGIPISGFKQTKLPVNVLLLVDRLDFQITDRMKAWFHSVHGLRLLCLSPSCPSFMHTPHCCNLCFYSELVLLLFSIW